jgi:hypothetical protein
MTTHKTVRLPKTGQMVTLVDRKQLKANPAAPKLHMASTRSSLPVSPPSWSWNPGHKACNDILGNDNYGDCYAALLAHLIESWVKANGRQITFIAQQVIDWYLGLAGGDYGLSDEEVWPAAMIEVAQSGHRVSDWAVCQTDDPNALSQIGYVFGGNPMTLAVPDHWIDIAEPGAVWDGGRNVRPNPANGHAVFNSARRVDGGWDLETWGFDKPIHLTDRGAKSCDAEWLASVGVDQFAGGKNPFGLTPTQVAAAWKEYTGRDVQLGGGPDPDPEIVALPSGHYTISTSSGGVLFTPLSPQGATLDNVQQYLDALGQKDLLTVMEIVTLLMRRQLPVGRTVMTGGVAGKGGHGPHQVDIKGGASS